MGYLGGKRILPDARGKMWGHFCIANPNRTGRSESASSPCALCRPRPEEASVSMNGSSRRVFVNENPLIENQLLLVPRACRPEINADDVELLLAWVARGQGLTLEGPTAVDWLIGDEVAGYVNLGADSGRSQPHLHLNVVPVGDLTLPEVRPPPPACSIDGALLSWTVGIPYVAIAVSATSTRVRAEAVRALVQALIALGLSANVLAFPAQRLGADDEVDALVVPRTRSLAPSVGQKVGGLELLTGVLLPAPTVAAMTVAKRDQALREVTVTNDEEFDRVARLGDELRRRFGLKVAGRAVFMEGSS